MLQGLENKEVLNLGFDRKVMKEKAKHIPSDSKIFKRVEHLPSDNETLTNNSRN